MDVGNWNDEMKQLKHCSKGASHTKCHISKWFCDKHKCCCCYWWWCDDCMRGTLYRIPLVPMFAFGENDIYKQVANPVGSRLRRFQTAFTKVLTFSLPLFYGHGLFNCTFGLLPFRHPVSVVGQYLISYAMFLFFPIQLHTGGNTGCRSTTLL